MRSAVVAVGDELLLGDVVNGNAATLGRLLAGAGAPVAHSSMVGDDVADIVRAVRRAMDDVDVVVLTGGLGPTVDDLTRDALAAVAGVPVDRVPALEERLREKYAAYRVAVPDAVLRQADVPRGAQVLDNPAGSAPGLRLEVGGRTLLALPGPPHEMTAVLAAVLGELAARSGQVRVTRTLRCGGAGESEVAELVDAALDLPPAVRLAYLSGGGVVQVRLSTTAADVATAEAALAPHLAAARAVLGDRVFGEGDDTLAEAVVSRLRRAGQTVAVAESLTGGLFGGALTDVPGASAAFRGGVQVYAADLKAALAGVPTDVLAAEGPVSAVTAAAMADGVRARLRADWGVGLTGVAGPGEQDGHPPGTLHVAVSGPSGTTTLRRRLPGDRARVRLLAVAVALDALRRRLL